MQGFFMPGKFELQDMSPLFHLDSTFFKLMNFMYFSKYLINLFFKFIIIKTYLIMIFSLLRVLNLEPYMG